MKIISFVVPCYNSQEYMEKCINSLLVNNDSDIEIIIVDDGSTDNTASIADKFEADYPDIIKTVHQTNGGHGKGVNTGLKYATGEFFKVIDSDDWVDPKALEAVLTALRMFVSSDIALDMMITNYVYEHVADGKQNIISYTGVFPENKVFGWEDMIRIDPIRYIIMHSVTYRTKLLRDCGLVLPEHTFYVDNLVLYHPLPYVKRMFYLNVDFYRYYIGRTDQSVNEKVMIGRIDQQIKITNILLDDHDLNSIKADSPKLGKYMIYYLSIIYTITSTLLALDNTPQSDQKFVELWQRLKDKDNKLYKKIRYFSKAFFMALPGKAGKRVSKAIYKIVRRVYKFN